MSDPFTSAWRRRKTEDGLFSPEEVALANRNHGALLELLALDETPAGAHYLLTHFDVPLIDRAVHRLRFCGGFEAPFELSMGEIEALPSVSLPVTLECAGNGRAGVSPRSHSMPWRHEAFGTATWTGTPLAPLIERARPAAETVEVSFTGADYGYDKGVGHHFARSLTLEEIGRLEVLLVYAMNGQPLLPQHGAPLRLIVPGWFGMASVKWLTAIEALSEPFQGFQQVETYRYRASDDEPGEPVREMRVKSLMVPPGVPDWTTRKRLVAPGRVELFGRAWSGGGRRIARVEVGIGDVWADARLDPATGRYAWTGWRFEWQAEPGRHVLRCRATDDAGDVQPLTPPWDVAGFGNNAVQRVEVYVR